MFKKLFGLLIIILVFFLVFKLVFNDSLSSRLDKWRINLDISRFEVGSFSKDKSNVSAIERLEAMNRDAKVFIDRITITSHEKYIEDKKFLLASLFEPTTSPYPEVITNIIECPNEFKPKVRKTDNGIVYTLFAGERYNYGICSQDLIKYQSEYGIFDCDEKGVFEIRAFSKDDKEMIKQIIESFKC